MNAVSPSELYKDPANAQEIARWHEFWSPQFRGAYTLEEILPPLDEAVKHGDLADHLRTMDDVRDRRFVGATLALGALPPKIVLDAYGEETLVWATANSSHRERSERLMEGLEKHARYDGGFLLKAIRLNFEGFPRPVDHQKVLNDYNLMAYTHSGALDSIDLSHELQKAARPGVTLSDKRLRDYTLMPLRTVADDSHFTRGDAKDWAGKWVDVSRLYSIYLDLPSGFAVSYKGIPQAVATYRAHGENGLMIGQMQGIKGYRITPKVTEAGKAYTESKKISARGLMPLDWQRLLVSVSAAIGKNLGKDGLAIHTRGVSEHIRGTKALEMYDKPAEAMGFMQGEDSHWHKPINEQDS